MVAYHLPLPKLPNTSRRTIPKKKAYTNSLLTRTLQNTMQDNAMLIKFMLIIKSLLSMAVVTLHMQVKGDVVSYSLNNHELDMEEGKRGGGGGGRGWWLQRYCITKCSSVGVSLHVQIQCLLAHGILKTAHYTFMKYLLPPSYCLLTISPFPNMSLHAVCTIIAVVCYANT